MLKFVLSMIALVLMLVFGSWDADAATVAPARERIAQELIKGGEAALAKGDAVVALEKFESALVANPKSTAAYIGLGRAHASLERPKSAMEYYDAALQIDPNNRSALELQSLGYLKQGRISAAERNLTRLKRLCASGCVELDRVDAAISASLKETEKALLAGTQTAADEGVKPSPDNPQN